MANSLTSTSGCNSDHAYTNGLTTALSHVQSGVALTDLNDKYRPDGQLTAIVDNLASLKSKAISYYQLNHRAQLGGGIPVSAAGVPNPVEKCA